MVAGNSGSGKTLLLQLMARSTGLQEPGDIQFGVLTPNPDECAAFEPHKAGKVRVTSGRGSDFFDPWGLMTAAMGAPELLTDAVNGYLFKPGDPAEAARRMEWFLDHPGRWSGMGTASLEKVQPHSLENIVHEYETLYEKVLTGTCLDLVA
jgi:hypothetical protein